MIPVSTGQVSMKIHVVRQGKVKNLIYLVALQTKTDFVILLRKLADMKWMTCLWDFFPCDVMKWISGNTHIKI
jgi:hypothetical protein